MTMTHNMHLALLRRLKMGSLPGSLSPTMATSPNIRMLISQCLDGYLLHPYLLLKISWSQSHLHWSWTWLNVQETSIELACE